MSKKEKQNKEINTGYESLEELYYSGKVKPSLNKIIGELENDPENLMLILLACKVLKRTKDFDRLSAYADTVIKLSPEISDGYYYKGVALQFVKGKEQEAVKAFNKALEIDPDNLLCLNSKAAAHMLLFKDFDLPLKFADQHRAKAEACLQKVFELVEQKENPHYKELFILAEANMMAEQALTAKMCYLKAVNAFEDTDESEQNKNIYKDIIKGQRNCIKQLEKFTDLSSR